MSTHSTQNHNKYPKLGAIAVVLHKEHVLLVRRKKEPDKGLWGYPGGHVEIGETVSEAAIRELFEETSVVAAAMSHLKNLDIILRNDKQEVEFHYLLVAVLCDFKSGSPTPMDDVFEARWVPYNDVMKQKIGLSKKVDVILELAINSSG